MRTVKLFSLYKFRIKVLACDGASSNLALLKVLAGYKAFQLPAEEQGDGYRKYLPKMEVHNSYDLEEDNKVFMMICPSHQVCHLCIYSVDNKKNYLSHLSACSARLCNLKS